MKFERTLGIASLVVVASCFIYLGKSELSEHEQVMFSILLTIASTILSWVISHIYYEKSHEKDIFEVKEENTKNIKLYATKAAEKVKNLSTELQKLSTYLVDELETDDYLNDKENLFAKQERIRSTIQIISTLKSINDGSLSDWRGVIPNEIKEIEDREREREENIGNIVEDYKLALLTSVQQTAQTGDEDILLKEEIQKLNLKLDSVVSQVTGVPKRTPTKKQKVSIECPACGVDINYQQKPTQQSRKNITCNNCKSSIRSTWEPERGFGLSVTVHSNERIPDEKFLEMVEQKMPAQPWPKGTSQLVGMELNVSKSKMKRAVNELIKRGKFKNQINGILYIPEAQRD